MQGGYKRAAKENNFNFVLSLGRRTGMPEVWQHNIVSRSHFQKKTWLKSLPETFPFKVELNST